MFSIRNLFRRKFFLLPPEVTVNGSLEISIPARIEGSVSGDVKSSAALFIAPNANIRGHVHAEDLEVYGKIMGDVYVHNKAMIGDTAYIKGDVTAIVMELRESAVIEGAIRKDFTEVPTPAANPEQQNDQPEKDEVSAWF